MSQMAVGGIGRMGAWLRANLFHSPWSAALTLLLGGLLLHLGWQVWQWGVVAAVWGADSAQCQAVRGSGACWGVVAEKWRVIVFGRYPYAEQWRPAVASLLLMGLVFASLILWRKGSRWLLALWLAGLPAGFVLMYGGVLGLTVVSTDQWGGLPLTLLLATLAVVGAFPLGVLLALGRASSLPIFRALCTVYIELVRGVPLITVLFMAAFLFPLFLPEGTSVDVLLRVLVAMVLFAAAYLAEVVRGGLQAIPQGQYEAARALGLGYWQMQRHVILPQALSSVVPGLMNNFISTFKDTSLVTIVSLYELTGALGLALDGDLAWKAYKLEGYLFIAAVYFVFCYSLSRYSRWVEQQLAQGRR